MSKQRNTKDFQYLMCPWCEAPAAQADAETQSGFSRAHKHGKVSQRGNRLHVRCGACEREWLCAILRFRGWKPGQELGYSGPWERPEGVLQPAQQKVLEAAAEPEEEIAADVPPMTTAQMAEAFDRVAAALGTEEEESEEAE